MYSKKKSIIKELLGWVIAIIVALLIAELVLTYVIVNANIPSESMENTIMKDDRLIANKLIYKFEAPKRQDIIVFRYPVDNETLYIKRVIGLPGEEVKIIQGQIYINGSETPLKEDYLPEKWKIGNDGYVFNIPEDCYLVLGDNRNFSEDARYWEEKALEEGKNKEEAYDCQFVKKEQIEGKAMFRYWPISEFEIF